MNKSSSVPCIASMLVHSNANGQSQGDGIWWTPSCHGLFRSSALVCRLLACARAVEIRNSRLTLQHPVSIQDNREKDMSAANASLKNFRVRLAVYTDRPNRDLADRAIAFFKTSEEHCR